jgi:ATP-binding cassette subfamily B (MDR/TAP) protein 1
MQISLKNVFFEYPNKPDISVISDVSLDIPHNKSIALVGASGCGKSSIISLIERWYDPTSGAITFNGSHLKDIDNVWYHQT